MASLLERILRATGRTDVAHGAEGTDDIAPDPDSNSNAYDKWHENVSAWASRDPLSFAWHRAAASKVREHPRGRLLEVGCGRGDFAVYLARTFADIAVTAVDFSPTAIKFAEDVPFSGPNRPQFKVGNALDLPFPDQSFDWVVSCECLEHVPSPLQMCREIHRVLKPGGRFCVTTENYLNGMVLAWIHSWITGRPYDSGSGVQSRENFFVFWIVRKYLRQAGLYVSGTESCHYQWLLLPRVDPARLCTEQFKSLWSRALAKPFGRHFTFYGRRPEETRTPPSTSGK